MKADFGKTWLRRGGCAALAGLLLCSVASLSGCKSDSDGGKKETVVIKAGITENPVMDYSDMKFFKDMEEATGVRFEIEEMSNEKITLMFATGDFVDVMFGGSFSNSQLEIAANSGSVVELSGLLAENAPTWKKAFDENPMYYAASKFGEDKLYSLPNIRTLDADRGIRDVWWINQKWMDELNLKMPTTLAEFTDILRAFKANAGKGYIPENVMPWYFLTNGIISGQFDFYNTFGVPVYDYTYMGVKDGKVVNYATDPRLKTANTVLRDMFAEGLIAPESMTDTPNDVLTRTNQHTDTPYIGVFTGYWTPLEDYVPMTLFQSQEGVEPLIRRQPLGVTRNRMVIFDSCKYPEKVLQAMEWAVQDKNAIYLDFGIEGEQWTYDSAADMYTVTSGVEPMDSETPGNAIPGLLDDRFNGRVTFGENHSWYKRGKAIEIYKDNRIPLEDLIPPMSFSSEAQEKVDNYKLVICARYINNTVKSWINGSADINAGWDEYVNQINKLGMEDYVRLHQEAYDAFYGK